MPDEPVPMADLKENGGEEVLIAGTAAGAVAGGSSPGTARLTVLTGRCFIRQEENDLSFLVSPTRLTLSGRNGDLSGCLVGNTALLIAGVVLHLVLSLLCGVAVIRRMFVALTEDRDSKFISRSAWSLMLFALLYQGFCSCGVVLLFHADSVSEVILGIAALASVVVMPFIGLRMIRSVVDENRATYVLDPKSTRWTWVLGAGEWVSLRESSVEQFGCLFQQYLPRTVFFLFIFECSLSLCFACIEAVYVETWVQCGYKKVAFLVANTLYAAQLVRLMPHRLPFANGLELVVNVLTGLGLGTAAAACFSIDPMNHWGAGVSDVTFMFAAYTMLLKSAFCIGILFFVILSKRRVRLAGVPAEPISKIPTTPVTPSHSRAKVVSLTEVAETFPLDDVRDSQSTRGLSPKWSPESELLEPGLHTKSSLSLGLAHGRAPMPRLPRNRSGGSWAASQVSLADSFQLANPNPVLSPQPPRRKSFVYPCSSPSSPKSNAESVLTPLIQPSLPQLVSLHELHNREPQLKPAFPTLHEMPLPL
ncbi:hypothetical protein DIPPA_33613 [Diplonema papillatum]|nr:hypothetical protein DIPPA_33613 [Diplonema papillatum]